MNRWTLVVIPILVLWVSGVLNGIGISAIEIFRSFIK